MPLGMRRSQPTRAVPFNDGTALATASEALEEDLAAIILKLVMRNSALGQKPEYEAIAV